MWLRLRQIALVAHKRSADRLTSYLLQSTTCVWRITDFPRELAIRHTQAALLRFLRHLLLPDHLQQRRTLYCSGRPGMVQKNAGACESG
jgi:hypothetical protein